MKRLLGNLALALIALSACDMPAVAQNAAPAPTATAVSSPSIAAPAGGTTTKSADDYVLGVADKVRITVYNEANLSGEYPVNANGKVSMALIGEVKAAGLTPGALRDEIAIQLASGYLKNPQVSIDVLSFRPYYIMGEVTKPGEYPATSGMTVMNAVATAEGFTYRANQKFALIKHAGQTSEEKVRLTPDLLIRPGDTVRIAQRFF